jgi:predicted MFS family arabinose efflux permease
MNKNLAVLTIAQAFAQGAVPIVILLGGIVGMRMAPSASLATLPVALTIVGTALTTIPAALLMSKIGRKKGFLFGAIYASLAGILAAYAVSIGEFYLFCFSTFLIGSHNAFIQQYRFAVTESVPTEKIGPSLSVLMLAGVVAAYIGPESAQRMKDILSWGEFSGSFMAISILMSITFCALLFYSNAEPETSESENSGRPLSEIIRQHKFILAVVAAAVGFGVMSFIMIATPVSMHQIDHISLDDTTWVIQSHIMAMYLPSLFSGILIAQFGAERVISAGITLLCLCLAVGYVEPMLMHYWWALVLLGIGWNFLFLGGTTLLTQTYKSSERYKVQALNDFMVFSLQATAALGSGFVLATWGWDMVILLSLPWLILLLAVLWFGGRAQPQTGEI